VTRAARTLPLALLLLGGCGMYGPLFLLEDTPPEITELPPIATEPATAPADAVPEEPRDEDDPEGGS
jgi:hypothetical protein